MSLAQDQDMWPVRNRMLLARQAAGLSLSEMARRMGCSRPRVAEAETRGCGPSLAFALAWAQACERCPVWLIWGDDAARIIREHPLPDGCIPFLRAREPTIVNGEAVKGMRKKK
jgi:transcriptional regulator with XRE-family HTH domain